MFVLYVMSTLSLSMLNGIMQRSVILSVRMLIFILLVTTLSLSKLIVVKPSVVIVMLSDIEPIVVILSIITYSVPFRVIKLSIFMPYCIVSLC